MNQPYGGIRLDIPTINDNPGDFDRLFGLWREVNDFSGDVTFDFRLCRFLRPNAIAFLGGLARLIERRGYSAIFDWDTLNDPVKAILRQNGFASAFGYARALGFPGNSIPYREDIGQSNDIDVSQSNDIIDYLAYEWLGRGWVHVSDKLRNAIVGRVWEIYANAFLHAKSKIGVFSCGQFFWRMGLLKLAVIDFGVGIPSTVREFFKDDSSAKRFAATSCLRWAFEPGNSTIEGTGRGIGLDMLKEFVYANGGILEIYSENGYALFRPRTQKYGKLSSSFEGTAVNITLRCDERLYSLVEEGPAGPWF